MTKLERECIRIAEIEARQFKGSISFVHDGKHSYLKITIGQRSRKIALACTPRSDNQTHWVRQDIRRLAKEIMG